MTDVARLLRCLLPAVAASAVAAATALPGPTAVTTAALTTAAVTTAASPPVSTAGEWWLTALGASAARRDAPAAGDGVTVAVLSTGVDASHPDLTGSVIAGPDFGKTGREPGSVYWGDEGTASPTARGLAAGAASGQARPGSGLLLSLVRYLAIAACALIACLIGAILLARLRRRARSVPAAGIAAERSPGGLARRGRHARRQCGGHGGREPALAGFRPGSARGANVDAGVSPYRLRRLAGKPPWPPARPPGDPLTPAGVPPTLPPLAPKARATETRATETRAADAPLAPWERSPVEYSAAPVYQDPTPWPVSNTGPMYVWNPAATTAPLNIIGSEEPD